MFKIFHLLESIADEAATVTEFSKFQAMAEEAVALLKIESINLSETVQYSSAKQVYEHAIAKAYRQTRESIGDMNFGQANAKKAALQARKLLSIPPQVLRGDSATIKGLAIQNWNESLSKCIRESILDEAGAPAEEANEMAKKFIGGELQEVSDKKLANDVIELGHQKQRHVVKTATAMYHVISYELKGKRYVAIEAPGKSPVVYQKG